MGFVFHECVFRIFSEFYLFRVLKSSKVCPGKRLAYASFSNLIFFFCNTNSNLSSLMQQTTLWQMMKFVPAERITKKYYFSISYIFSCEISIIFILCWSSQLCMQLCGFGQNSVLDSRIFFVLFLWIP